MVTTLGVGEGVEYALEEAQWVIAGYAFADREFHFRPRDPAFGSAPQVRTIPRWAYRVYDCVPADPAPGLTTQDLLVVATMNVRFDSDVMLSLQTISSEVSDALGRIPPTVSFWDLKLDDLRPGASPEEDTPAWLLLRAWWLLRGAPGVDLAVAHKILHHKRPRLAPIIDRQTAKLLGEGKWARIHQDLTRQRDLWVALEYWFCALARDRCGVPLSRLRLHDILLWCQVTEQRAHAASEGQKLVE